NDFIELFNAGTSAADISGWSVQYSSSTSSTFASTNMTLILSVPASVIQPGHYFLIQEAAGAGGSQNLPTPDVTGTIAMSATAAKIALVNNGTSLGTFTCSL